MHCCRSLVSQTRRVGDSPNLSTSEVQDGSQPFERPENACHPLPQKAIHTGSESSAAKEILSTGLVSRGWCPTYPPASFPGPRQKTDRSKTTGLSCLRCGILVEMGRTWPGSSMTREPHFATTTNGRGQITLPAWKASDWTFRNGNKRSQGAVASRSEWCPGSRCAIWERQAGLQ